MTSLGVKELGEVMRLAFSKARSRIYTRRKIKKKGKNEGRTRKKLYAVAR